MKTTLDYNDVFVLYIMHVPPSIRILLLATTIKKCVLDKEAFYDVPLFDWYNGSECSKIDCVCKMCIHIHDVLRYYLCIFNKLTDEFSSKLFRLFA